jgi:hypothetical protein
MKRNWLILAFVFLFAATGVANAATSSTGGSKTVLIGQQSNAISDIVITETALNTLGSVEEIPVDDGENDLQQLPYPASPNYNGAGCTGNAFRFTVSLSEPGVTWEYHATSPSVFPSVAGERIGWIPIAPFDAPFSYYPADFNDSDPIANDVRLAAAANVEFAYYRDAIPPITRCYEWGHPVAVRNSDDGSSGYESRFDVVVTQVSATTLTVDVMRPATLGANAKIVLPGSVFRVNTTGVEGSSGESQPLMVTIAPAGQFGNTGVDPANIQVASLISGDNPGTGAGSQITAPDGDIREVMIGQTNQQASNIIISEEVDQQFQGATGNPQLSIALGNGILWHAPPTISSSGGVVATLATLTGYPTSEILVSVVQGPRDDVAGRIRVSDVHIDLDTTVPIGDVWALVGPTITSNNVQTLIGLDSANVDIANAIPATVISSSGTISVSSVDTFLLKINQAPATTVTGNLYVSVAVSGVPDLEGAVYFRPVAVPLPDGLYVKLVNDPTDGSYLPGAADFYYATGTLSESALPLRFIIGGVTSDLLGYGLTIKTFYTRSGEGLDQSVAIDTINILFTQ